MLRLLPLSRREAAGQPQRALPWESAHRSSAPTSPAFGELWNGFLRGGYPELATQPGRDIRLWHSSYIQTYLERDVRRLRQVGDLTQYRNFLRVLAARSAQLLNLTDVARGPRGRGQHDQGVAFRARGHVPGDRAAPVLRQRRENGSSRRRKCISRTWAPSAISPVSGDPEHAASGPMGGAIMETAVLSEIVKTLVHRGSDPQVYFWRTSAGSEVDFVVETGGKLVPIEVKLSATPRPAMAAAIRDVAAGLGSRSPARVTWYIPATYGCPLGPGVTALPFADL